MTTDVTPAECVGPVVLAETCSTDLERLAAEEGVTVVDTVRAVVGAVASRLDPGSDLRVLVIHGADERVVPTAGTDPSLGLRDLVRATRAAEPLAAARPALTLLVCEDERRMYVETTTDAADVPTAEAMASALVHTLQAATADPERPVRELGLMGRTEQQHVLGLTSYRDPRSPYRTMAEPFEEQVRRTPDAPALVDAHGAVVTYRELDERSNRLAHHLRGRGARPGVRVAVCLERSVQQVVAVYAAVRTGATYVPVDTDLPDERIGLILADADPLVVLVDPAGRDRVSRGSWQVVDVPADERWEQLPPTPPDLGPAPDGVLHLLYTSGTTGRPKGVATRTAAALANLDWMQRRYPYSPGDTALFKSSPGFDISIWELFWPLYHGARVVVCPPTVERDARALARLTEEHRVTLLFLVPTMASGFLDEISADRAPALRVLLCGGEPMSPHIPGAFAAALPGRTLVNAFGPTEAGPVTDDIVGPDTDGVPVGRPADNFRVHVLSRDLDLLPVGAPGEAYVAGRVGLADGYWRAPARTAERFVADPYGPPGGRMYRTGDLCRLREDGALDHLGRIDRQVKVRGVRVEPGEIEAVLSGHPDVGDCAVLAHGRPPRLLAFVVPTPGRHPSDLDPTSLAEHAATLLPTHMRPERILPVPALPSTVNSKIDHETLLAHWRAVVEAEEKTPEPPADPLEERVRTIYAEVLGRPSVGMLDSFVQLGGHSMLAIQLLGRCQDELGIMPDIGRLLSGTVRDVADSVRPLLDPADAG